MSCDSSVLQCGSASLANSSTSCMCLSAEGLNLQSRDAAAVSITWKYCCWYSSSGVLKLCGGAPASSNGQGNFLGQGKTELSKPKSSAAAVVFSRNSVNPSRRAFISPLIVSIISLVLCMCSYWRATLTVSIREKKLSMSFKEKKVQNFCRWTSSPLALPPASPFSFDPRSSRNSINAL